MLEVKIQSQDFDAGLELTRLRQQSAKSGAIASFIGAMRDLNDGDTISEMLLEHYPEMTEKAILSILKQAEQRWPTTGITVIHRIGRLLPNEQIVFVGVAAAHRGEAFQACEFVMDYLKTQAPFWKKEITDKGERWVDSRASDAQAAARW